MVIHLWIIDCWHENPLFDTVRFTLEQSHFCMEKKNKKISFAFALKWKTCRNASKITKLSKIEKSIFIFQFKFEHATKKTYINTSIFTESIEKGKFDSLCSTCFMEITIWEALKTIANYSYTMLEENFRKPTEETCYRTVLIYKYI